MHRIENHLDQPTPATPLSYLYRGGVEHDANRSAKRPGRKGVCELRTDDARVTCRNLSAMNLPPCTGECFGHTVGAGNLAPDHADLSSANLLLSPVNVRDLLAEIEAISLQSVGFLRLRDSGKCVLGGIGVIDALDLDQAGLGVGGPSATLVAEVATPIHILSVHLVRQRSECIADMSSC